MHEEEFAFFCDLIKRKCGIYLEAGKEYLVEARLDDVAKSLGCPSFTDFYRRVKFNSTPDIIERIIEAITTPETSFFRDASPFEALKTYFLPEIAERKKQTKSLRIWSACCSTGQEAYSTAMTIQDIGHLFEGWYVNILGTDISNKVLDIARAASYSQHEISRGLPVTHIPKYLRKDASRWVMNDKIRKMVDFRKLNLFDDFQGLGVFDLVFCRNVLIYFTVSDKKGILERLVQNVDRNGALILGSTETIFGITDVYTKKTFGKLVYYQVNQTHQKF